MAYTAIDDPSAYFHIQLYVGNNPTGQSITNDANAGDFQPDWLWIKSRDTSGGSGVNFVQDSTRGTTKDLHTSNDEAEHTNSNMLGSFDSDGFTIGSSASDNINKASDNYVAWQWKANGGTRTTNTESGDNPGGGYQANTTAGFSIVDYTGTGSAGTMAHGLGAVPHVILFKARSEASNDWAVYHQGNTSAPETDFLRLNTNGATTDNSNFMNDTAPTSSVFTVNTGSKVNSDGETYIAYCFTEKQGYSKFGSYTGNNAADGPFVYTGFKPAWVMTKRTDSTSSWFVFDNKRSPSNVVDDILFPNGNDAETTNSSSGAIDMLSNGFKIRGTNSNFNAASSTQIYMAFAEHPFVSSEGVPTTAR